MIFDDLLVSKAHISRKYRHFLIKQALLVLTLIHLNTLHLYT